MSGSGYKSGLHLSTLGGKGFQMLTPTGAKGRGVVFLRGRGAGLPLYIWMGECGVWWWGSSWSLVFVCVSLGFRVRWVSPRIVFGSVFDLSLFR